MARAEKGDEKDERKGRRLQPSGFDLRAALPAAPPQDECDSSVFKAAAMDKRTPLKHERVVVVTVESPPDGLCSAANSPTSLGPDGYAVQEGTPRLKLKLTAVHPALTQLIQVRLQRAAAGLLQAWRQEHRKVLYIIFYTTCIRDFCCSRLSGTWLWRCADLTSPRAAQHRNRRRKVYSKLTQ